MTTPGKYRHLARTSTESGHFAILAIDHRDNLKDSLQKHVAQPLTEADLSAFKLTVIQHLAPHISAVLVDPAYGIGPGIGQGALGRDVGLLAPLEVTNYAVHPSQRENALIPDWSVAKFKRAGGDGIKLLLFYHPDAPFAAEKRAFVARIIDDCARYDIPFFLEPIAFSLDPARPLPNDELRRVVIESARTFSQMGIDVLKTPFPLDVAHEPDEAVWRAALAELNEACSVPWALLSAGVDYPTFRRQAELACEAGASGVIAGRAIWAEAVALQGEAREAFLAGAARGRIAELAAIVRAAGTSWRDRVPVPDSAFDWYARYDGM